MSRYDFEAEIETKEGLIIPCSCEYGVSWGEPAVTHALPEDCHPGSDHELEDCTLTINDPWLRGLIEKLPEEARKQFVGAIEDKFLDDHRDAMIEHAIKDNESDYEPRDYYYDEP